MKFPFSSCQISYQLFLVPEKAQSISWQNKKLPTLTAQFVGNKRNDLLEEDMKMIAADDT